MAIDMGKEIRRFEYENKEIRRKAILKVLNTKIDNYLPSIVFITDFQATKFYDICVDKVKHKSYSFTINYNKPYELFYFVFFLTKKQIKENQKARRKRTKYTITFSGDHFKKTCLKSIELTEKINYILRYKLISGTKKVDLLQNLFYLNHELINISEIINIDKKEIINDYQKKMIDDAKRDYKKIMKEINKIYKKLNQNHIPVPNNLSKLNRMIKPKKNNYVSTLINYTNIDDIDNKPNKNTTKKIQITHKKINLPTIKPKINQKIRKELFDANNVVDDSSDWDSDSSEAKKFYKKAEKFQLQAKLKHLKKENVKKAKQLKSLKSKQDKINLDTVVKNTLKKYKKPKPKKKSILDVIDLPKPLVI